MEEQKNTNEINNKTASFDPAPNPEFLREKIKQKPINKKKFLRRTFFSILTAATFGLVACLTFRFLEPLISAKLNRSDTVSQDVKITTVDLSDSEDEILPEDMYATDSEMIEEALLGNANAVSEDIQHIESMISNITFDIEDYRSLYRSMAALADSVSNSIVTINGYTTNVDVLNSTYDSTAELSGLIVADNGPSLLILAKNKGLLESDEIQVTFHDGFSTAASILGYDDVTEYLILSVNHSALPSSTVVSARPASLGTSRSTTLLGTPVMALGSPTGAPGSLSYGMITSNASKLDYIDADYSLITTDIVGNSNSTGVIVSLRGYVIGIIDNTLDDNSQNSLINAMGITELKPLIEKLSNQTAKAYLGVQGTDITSSMKKAYSLPDGIYFSSIEVDSPAMEAGLQNGDILVSVNNSKPASYHDFIAMLFNASPEDEWTLVIQRQSVDDYIPLTINVVLGSKEYTTEE